MRAATLVAETRPVGRGRRRRIQARWRRQAAMDAARRRAWRPQCCATPTSAICMDARDAWPTPGHLSLDGFAFDDLGGFEGESGTEMRARGAGWWDNWARLDQKYTPTPYTQLAAALSKSGDPDDANEVRYLGRRTRARKTVCADAWRLGSAGSCALATALKWGAGYGIGYYSFRVLFWLVFYLAARRRDPVVFRAGRSPPPRGANSGASAQASRGFCPALRSTRSSPSSSATPTASGSRRGRASSFPLM